MDAQNFKKLCPQIFYFFFYFENALKILSNPQTICLLLFYIVKREKMLTDKAI